MNSILEPPSLCKSPVRSIPAEVELKPNLEAFVSAEGLVARFALPCAWDRYEENIVTEPQWQRLRTIAFRGKSELYETESDQIFLSTMFPNLLRGMPGRWDFDSVLYILREHRGHLPEHLQECATHEALIGAALGNQFSLLTGDMRMVYSNRNSPYNRVFDLYRLNTVLGSSALVHKSVIFAII